MRSHGSLKVSVIYPFSGIMSGIGLYADRLISGLQALKGLDLEIIKTRKREITFMGKPVLGTASQILSSKLKRPSGDVVHSLAPTVINSKTNVVTLHDLIALTMKKQFADTYYRKKGYEILFNAVKGVQNIIVFTEHWKNVVKEEFGIDDDRISVVSQAIDHSQFYYDPDPGLKEDDHNLVVTVGDMNPRKRYDILFEALGDKADIDVVHIGPANAWVDRERELRVIASKYDNIQLLGQIKQDLLRKYMSTADLLVHLSEGEGFGYTPVEAMACGTNVLVNDLPVFRETLGEYAFFTQLDAQKVSDAVKRAIAHKMPSEKLREYTDRYSIEKMASGTVKVYRKVVA